MSQSVWFDHPGTPHRWTKHLNDDGFTVVATRACDLCGLTEIENSTYTTFATPSTGGISIGELRERNEQRRLEKLTAVTHGIVKYGMPGTRKGVMEIMNPNGPGEPLSSVGGIVAYSKHAQILQLGDGSRMSLEFLLTANPGVDENALTRELEKLPERFFTPIQLADRIRSLAAAEKMATALGSFGDAVRTAHASTQEFRKLEEALNETAEERIRQSRKRGFSDEAVMDYIMDEIDVAPDSRAAASEWLTRVTSTITKRMNELEGDEDGE